MDDGKINVYTFNLDPMNYQPRGYCNLHVAKSVDAVIFEDCATGKKRTLKTHYNGKTKTIVLEAVAEDEYIPYCLYMRDLLHSW